MTFSIHSYIFNALSCYESFWIVEYAVFSTLNLWLKSPCVVFVPAKWFFSLLLFVIVLRRYYFTPGPGFIFFRQLQESFDWITVWRCSIVFTSKIQTNKKNIYLFCYFFFGWRSFLVLSHLTQSYIYIIYRKYTANDWSFR